jgi:hypothetical protein
MAQVLSCRLLAAEAKVRYRGNICGKQSLISTGSSAGTSFSPVSITPTMLYSHLQRNNTFYQKGTQATLGNLHTSDDALMGYREELDRKP